MSSIFRDLRQHALQAETRGDPRNTSTAPCASATSSVHLITQLFHVVARR
jgi:hypothetical protein